MYADGYHNQINIDNAPNCIRKMAELNQHTCPEMEYMAMDATSTEFEAGRFDCIIEKSLIDGILANVSSGVAIATKVVHERLLVVDCGSFLESEAQVCAYSIIVFAHVRSVHERRAA